MHRARLAMFERTMIPRERAPDAVIDHAIELAPGVVRVFARRLAVPDRERAELEALLSPDETARARRYVFDEHRREFAVARATLRCLLARATGVPPRELTFQYGPHGKPALDPSLATLRFNVSHSRGVAVFALSADRDVGIDVEHKRADVDALALAKRFFSPAEHATLAELGDAERLHAFFRCWTRKEAFLKAIAAGLSYPLDGFDVAVRAGDDPRVRATRPDPQLAARWALCDLDLGPAHAAALAMEITSDRTAPAPLEWLDAREQSHGGGR